MISDDQVKQLLVEFQELGQLNAAELLVRMAIESDRYNADLYVEFANILAGTGNSELAKQSREIARRLRPEHAERQDKLLSAKSEVNDAQIINHKAYEEKKTAAGRASSKEEKPAARDRDTYLDANYAFHPYFGFVFKPRTGVNSYGYMFPDHVRQYPYNGVSPETYVVGIFGGSVAGSLHYDCSERLKESLSKLPMIPNREIIILPFAQGSYRQPQQVMSLIYFTLIGQKFDLVINLDGFNESNGCRINQTEGIHHALPSHNMLRSLRLLSPDTKLAPEQLRYLLRVSKRKSLIAWLDGISDRHNLEALCKPIKSVAEKSLARLAARPPQRDLRQDDTLVQLEQRPKLDLELAPQEVIDVAVEDVARLWCRSSILMHHICDSVGADYVHAIQPNQYFGEKPFSAEELEKYYAPGTYTAEIVRQTYPAYMSEVDSLRRNNVNFCDLTPIFNATNETVYRDAQCHLNVLGNEIIADSLSKHIGDSLAPKGT